ncbi:MAG TPA: hypothetical protein VHE30_10630 [Polyangiaceae bacterium]|nr:hypothetical protein [Polyangiaceae bacterium]
MYARASLIRGGGLCALTLSLFYGCGGLNEADYYPSTQALDGGVDASSGRCGDGKLDANEFCDGDELGGGTCESLTMITGSKGTVRCTRTCRYDLTDCSGANGTGGAGTGGNGTGGNGTGGNGNGTGGRNTGGTGTGGGPATGGGPNGGVDVGCTSNSDCTGNQICCGERANGQLSSFSCRNRCGNNGFAVECAKASDCGNGQVCCGTLNANGNAYTGIACAATCAQNGQNERILCTRNSECTGGDTCQNSTLLTSDFKVCRQ